MRRFCPAALTLRTKLLIVVGVPLAVAAALLTAAFLLFDLARGRQELVEQTQSIIRATSQDFERLHLLQQQDVAVDLVDRLRSFPQIEQLVVENLSGEVVFSYVAPDRPASAWRRAAPGKPEVDESGMWLAVSIESGGKAFATVLVILQRKVGIA